MIKLKQKTYLNNITSNIQKNNERIHLLKIFIRVKQILYSKLKDEHTLTHLLEADVTMSK